MTRAGQSAGWSSILAIGSPGREVLLPAACLGIPDAEERQLAVRLTRQQVEDAPGISADLPVSRQMELQLSNHYSANTYLPRGADVLPLMGLGSLREPMRHFEGEGTVTEMGDAHLRSIATVTGYHLRATDGDIGHIDDFIVDDDGWRVKYLSVDTRNWWPGAHVLILPQLVLEVDWSASLIHIRATQQKVRDSPPASAAETGDADAADRLSVYYGFQPFPI
ncbi:MAG: PRC-barrel domain containing protein [Alphaproteobacteria bacterium]|nr:MAG: PRC-barrel domain containing protein [Alphaproteobacteria bacterium]